MTPSVPPSSASRGRTPPDRSPLARHWGLDPEIDFLNHGSFGACPTRVLERQSEYRAMLEAEPVRFFVRRLEPLLDEARAALGAFVGADPDDLAFVPNATVGVNSVLRSLVLGPGDEVLTTNHEYNACMNVLRYTAERTGARIRVVEIPFPVRSAEEVVGRVLEGVGERTRLAMLSHITSPTAVVLPIGRLVGALRERGVETLVDGAHGPGMVDLRLEEIGAAFYTGNCHKWMCTPKGSAFLHVRRDLQNSVRPAVISHGANATRADRSRFRLEFDWTGTMDPTAYLCIPEAIAFMASLVEGGWDAVRARNRALALRGREIVSGALGVPGEALVAEEMVGSIASVPIADAEGPAPESALHLDPRQTRLLEEWGIEVPLTPWPAHPKRLVRISAQLYNDEGQYRRLGEALGVLGG